MLGGDILADRVGDSLQGLGLQRGFVFVVIASFAMIVGLLTKGRGERGGGGGVNWDQGDARGPHGKK
jgi:hypothetical protein